MHAHTQCASKQCNHAKSTYRVDIAQVSQISYLLSEPVTCPIYLLSGGIPGDLPTANDVNTWPCLSHLILISQSVAWL